MNHSTGLFTDLKVNRENKTGLTDDSMSGGHATARKSTSRGATV